MNCYKNHQNLLDMFVVRGPGTDHIQLNSQLNASALQFRTCTAFKAHTERIITVKENIPYTHSEI